MTWLMRYGVKNFIYLWIRFINSNFFSFNKLTFDICFRKLRKYQLRNSYLCWCCSVPLVVVLYYGKYTSIYICIHSQFLPKPILKWEWKHSLNCWQCNEFLVHKQHACLLIIYIYSWHLSNRTSGKAMTN